MAEEFADRMQRILAEGMAQLSPQVDESESKVRELEDGSIHITFQDVPPLIAQKLSMPITISTELAMDLGFIPYNRPPRHYNRRTRFRWWLDEQRERLAGWLYRLVAGHNLPEDPDDY